MELGSLVCTPTAPQCDECPLSARCVARALGRQEEIPARTPRPAVTEVSEAAVVVRRDGRRLLVQRPPTGRWANMWEFPHGPRTDGETPAAAAVRLAAELTGLDVRFGRELRTLRHGVTRYRITLACVEAEHVGGDFGSAFYVQGRWLADADLAAYPVSAPQRRLIRTLATE
jgi:A/G-specific adenine glycosylase